MMRFIAILGLLGFALLGGPSAQEAARKVTMFQEKGAAGAAPAQTATVAQILEKYVKALGGEEALSRLSTRVGKGRYETSMGVSGTFQSYAKAPNKILTVTDMPQLGEVREGFDGAVAWRQDGQNQAREKTGSELAGVKLESEFSRPARLAQLYPTLKLAGIEKVNGRDAYALDAVPAAGSPEKLYFDTQTGLLLKRVTQRESPLGQLVIETIYEDYREVDGVKLPFLVRRLTSAVSSTLNYEEIKHNLPVEDKIFQKPPVN